MDLKVKPRRRRCVALWPFKRQPRSALPASGSNGGNSIWIYRSLDVSRNEIRILELAPGIATDPINVKLSTISLDNSAPYNYEALSYVWGDASVKREITLSSTPFTVTQNLEAALIRMRLTNQTRRLWVDAICINQDDVNERENQVQNMGKIYSLCDQVLIWLGPEEPGDANALCLVDIAINGALGTLRRCNLYDIASSADFDGDYNAIKCNNYYEQLGELLDRPWWSRSWTLQELALAPVAIFYFGDLSLSWEQLFTAKTRIQNGPLIGLCPRCMVAKEKTETTIGHMWVTRQAAQAKLSPNELLNVAIANRSRLATDPRDKLFAFFGLNITDMQSFRLSYTDTVAYVYSQFAWKDILQCRNLRVLNCAVDNDRTRLDLPSWVPDWSIPSRRPDYLEICRVGVRYYNYDACGGQDFAGKLHKHNNSFILEIEGFKIDTVYFVGDLGLDHTKSTTGETFAVLKQWFNLSGIKNDPTQTYQHSMSTLTEAFWRTVIGDIVYEDGKGDIRVTPIIYEKSFWKAWEFYDPETNHQAAVDISENGKDHNLSSTTGAIIIALYHNQGRRFITSEEGLFGNGCRNIRPGDEIWIVKGGRMPLVLRKTEEDDFDIGKAEALSPLYKLVGDCYIHGTMDGERVPEWNNNYRKIFLA